MVGKRLLWALAGCSVMASAALADDVGFIDCHEHPDATQVFAKARQTHETVTSIPCGERFTILLYGFIFSRIQTKDGQVGYVFSNGISVDHSGASVQRTAPSPVAAPTPAAKPATGGVEQASPSASPQVSAAKPESAPAAALTPAPSPTATAASTPNPAPTATAEPLTKVTETSSTAAHTSPAPNVPPPNTPAPSQPEAAVPTSTPVAAPAAAVTPAAEPIAKVTETSATPAQPASTIFPRPVTAPVETPAPEPAPSAPVTSMPETAAAPATPNPTPAAAETQPEPAQPPAPAMRAAEVKERWEKPNRGTHRAAVLEFFGGYGFTSLNNGSGSMTNLNGVLGSFGWNVRPWLQLVADTSYNYITVGNTKTVLYGNHWGPRLHFHGRYPWGAVPFVEGLVGGSRVDTTLSGTGGYTTSDNCFSFKIGGGIDIHPFRHFKIRLFDFDYYRTAFGANLHQNNYSASVGVVLRLFGGGSE